MLQAGTLGLAFLILVIGAMEPHWRSPRFLTVAAVSLLGGGLFAYALFSREWRAAERKYRTSV
jgi:hypothetical protein